MRTTCITALLAAVSCSGVAIAANTPGTAFGGWVSAEARIFLEDPWLPFQDDETVQGSVAAQFDLQHVFEDSRWKLQITPFGRVDSNDDRRTHWDLREANISYSGDGWDVLLGAHQVFWGRTEMRNPVNIINQVDFVEGIDGDQFLGQPMLNVSFFGDWGKLSLFGMTGFREKTYPDCCNRLGPPFVDTDFTTYESGDEEWKPEFAVRYENSIEGFDFGFSYFHGNSREAQLVPVLTPDGPRLSPRYQEIDQVGFEAAWGLGDLLLKTEMIYRWVDDQPFCLNYDPGQCIGTPDDFFAQTTGLEYTMKNVFDDGTDVGILLEYSSDDRNRFNPSTVFDNDVLIGLRATLNDSNSSQFLGAFVFDADNGDTYLYAEASFKLDDDLRINAEARFFNSKDPSLNPTDPSPLIVVDHDDYIGVKATYNF